MDLFIETLTGTAFELRVSPFETIMSVKAKIQRLEGKLNRKLSYHGNRNDWVKIQRVCFNLSRPKYVEVLLVTILKSSL